MGEIEKLKEYNHILKLHLRDKVIVSVQSLIEIRDHIELCDRGVETRFEKILVLESALYFEKYYRFWCDNKPAKERSQVRQLIITTQANGVKREPEKPEQTQALVKRDPSRDNNLKHHKNLEITSNDRLFLKSLQIAVDKADEDPGEDDNEC